VASFNGLPHRLEYVGEARGVHFYNDSISTIPQATIEALKAFPETSTLIVGGHDRGIDYSGLADYLPNSNVKTIVFLGLAGRMIFDEVKKLSSLGFIKTFLPKSFKEGFEMALENTKEGGVCLLSPAASSYDEFRNFEHRGEVYKTLVREFAK
jgi:UDP-N-acetylmuramoylalanine-D-glutamate ligase